VAYPTRDVWSTSGSSFQWATRPRHDYQGGRTVAGLGHRSRSRGRTRSCFCTSIVARCRGHHRGRSGVTKAADRRHRGPGFAIRRSVTPSPLRKSPLSSLLAFFHSTACQWIRPGLSLCPDLRSSRARSSAFQSRSLVQAAAALPSRSSRNAP